MKDLCVISEDELERVTCAARLFYIPENEGYGITLSVVDGKRAWVIVNDQIEVMIIGGEANFKESYVLPLRQLDNGDIQAHLGDHTVKLSVGNGKARFTGDSGFSEMQLLPQIKRFSEFDTTNITTAEVLSNRLGFLVLLGTALPSCVNEQDIKNLVPQISRINFNRTSIEVSSDFAEVNSPASHSNVEAVVKGSTGEVVVSRYFLRSLNTLISQEDMITIKLSCNTETGNAVLVETKNWKVILRQQPSGASSYFNLIEKFLEAKTYEYEVFGGYIIRTIIEGRQVEIEMLDGRLSVIRCTTPLVSGVEKTWALLRELDQLNESRICTKFFIRDNTIIACIDIVCNPNLNVEREIYALLEDVETLGGCLSSLANQLELFA